MTTNRNVVMIKLCRLLSLLQRDVNGVTALEYGLIAAVIGGVVITGTQFVGNGLGDVFNTIANALVTAGT